MTIAHLVNQYPHVSHTFIRREIVALEALGHQVVRFSIRPPPELIDPLDQAEVKKTIVILHLGLLSLAAAGVRTVATCPIMFVRALCAAIRMGRRSQRGLLRHVAYLLEACYLRCELKKLAVTHLHAHFGTNSAALAMLTRILGGPPYSFTVHGPEEFDQPLALSLPDKIALAKFVVAISSFGRSQLCRWTPPTAWDKIRVVRCGLDAELLAAGAATVPDVASFACIGRLCEQKGQLLLLDALEIVRRQYPNVNVVMVGDGPMRPCLEQRVEQGSLGENVTITGWQSNAQVRDWISRSRAMVLPSFAEGLPVVIMEAYALRRPVISTFVAGIPELVKPGVNGWLVPAGSVDQLASAMTNALATPVDQLNQYAAEGAKLVETRHNAIVEARRLADYIFQQEAQPC